LDIDIEHLQHLFLELLQLLSHCQFLPLEELDPQEVKKAMARIEEKMIFFIVVFVCAKLS